MRKILLLICLVGSLTSLAQSRYVRVTTVKGAVYKGALKEFKAFQHVVVDVEGKSVTIPYNDLAYIDDLKLFKAENVEPEPESEPQPLVAPEPEPVVAPVEAVVPAVVPEPEPVVVPEPAPVVTPIEAVVPEPDPVVAPVEAPKPTSKWSNYKGFLLSTGNNVYLNCVSESTNNAYNDAALDVLKRQIMRDGFWTIVDNPEDAHFAINYTLRTEGSGKTVISISSDRVDNMEMLGNAHVPEDVDDYRKIVYDLYQKYLFPLLKKIEMDNVPKRTKKLFTVE